MLTNSFILCILENSILRGYGIDLILPKKKKLKTVVFSFAEDSPNDKNDKENYSQKNYYTQKIHTLWNLK